MEIADASFEKYLFVCEHRREEGVYCGASGESIRDSLKQAVKHRGLASRVRVSRAGCLDVCSEGPNVLLMPDAIWFKKVSSADLDSVLAETTKRLKNP